MATRVTTPVPALLRLSKLIHKSQTPADSSILCRQKAKGKPFAKKLELRLSIISKLASYLVRLPYHTSIPCEP